MAVLENLNPKKVFYYFEEICKIPHGSGNVGRLSDYLADFAKERGLFCIQDAWKNIIIVKDAAAGYEEEAPIILQGHMDMVAVKKPGSDIDMAREGLRLVVDGDEIYAEDTSLGGDDGIAVAYALAILDAEDIPHPRLEVIITVDEETGMDGARELDVSMLKGKRMLNLDSEEEGYILAGCAGGARVDWKLPVRWEEKADINAGEEAGIDAAETAGKEAGRRYALCVKGLQGGHSGAEIDKERGNANILLGRLLYRLSKTAGICLVEMEGGLADNAIPREARAVVWIEEGKEKLLADTVKAVELEWKQELQTKDPGIRLEAEELDAEGEIPDTEGEMPDTEKEAAGLEGNEPCLCGENTVKCICAEDTKRLVSLLAAAPNGVQGMSADIKGLVETSLNLGIIGLKEEGAVFQFSVRSSLESAKMAVVEKLESIASMAGASCEVRGDYPGWAYQKESPFRDMAVEVFREMYGKEPVIQAIHAGLECGLLSAKIPGLECISMGPDMKNIHTTEERLSISSTERVWKYVLEMLKRRG